MSQTRPRTDQSIEFDPTKEWVFSKRDKFLTLFWFLALPASLSVFAFFPEQKIFHGILIVFLGLCAMLPSILDVVKIIRSKHWIKVKGKVLSSSVGSRVVIGTFNFLGISSFFPKIHYKYLFNERPYWSNTFSIIPLDYHYLLKEQAKTFQENFQIDQEIDVWIDPEQPHTSIIVQSVSTEQKTTYLSHIILGMIVMMFGLVYMYVTL